MCHSYRVDVFVFFPGRTESRGKVLEHDSVVSTIGVLEGSLMVSTMRIFRNDTTWWHSLIIFAVVSLHLCNVSIFNLLLTNLFMTKYPLRYMTDVFHYHWWEYILSYHYRINYLIWGIHCMGLLLSFRIILSRFFARARERDNVFLYISCFTTLHFTALRASNSSISILVKRKISVFSYTFS